MIVFMFTFNKYKNFPDWLLGQKEKSKQSQTAGNDADIKTGDKMSTIFYTKNGTRHEQKWFEDYDTDGAKYGCDYPGNEVNIDLDGCWMHGEPNAKRF